VDGSGLNKWVFVVLLISGMLLLSTISFVVTFSNSSVTVYSSLEPIRTMYEDPSGIGKVRSEFVPGEVLVRFGKQVSEREIFSLRVAQGANEVFVSRFSGVRRWRVHSSKTVLEWMDFFNRHPLVDYAEPNYVAHSMMAPNDSFYDLQWHFDNPTYGGINMEDAWDLETGDSNVVVAVVDTGVAYENFSGPGFWHLDSYNAYGGSGSSWWCGVDTAPSSWTDLYGSNPTPPGYGNGWRQYLQHYVDLTGAIGTVTLSYFYKLDIEWNYDYFYVEVSDDGGASWTELMSYTNRPGGSGRGGRDVDWTQDSVDLTGFTGSNVLVRFRFSSDEEGWSDEDGLFDSDGAVYIDEVEVVDGGGQIFYDDMESGVGSWETSEFMQAPDLEGTSFWDNVNEVPDDGLDNDGNGFIDDVNGWDFVNRDAHPNDDNAHGTHVSGTVAQTTNNGLGVAGVAYGATVMPVKVLSAEGAGTHQWIADGIYYAVDNGADIINLSLGGPASTTMKDAIAYAYNHGVTVFAASGNGGSGTLDYPAAYEAYVVAVGATQYDESRAPYSNYGSSLDIVAPGGNTGLDQNGDGYADGVLQNTFGNTTVDWAYWFYQGTSMATPHAAGVAALLLSIDPSLTPDEVKSVLESTAEELGAAGRDDFYGYGLIDARAALENVSRPMHLLLTVNPGQSVYLKGQEVSLVVNVFNQENLALNSTLSLAVTGPGDYYFYDFQNIAVAADTVEEYTFDWVVPDVAGTYIVEVGLVPPELTAYDVAWLVVG
jgi:subtilisin family serine protease